MKALIVWWTVGCMLVGFANGVRSHGGKEHLSMALSLQLVALWPELITEGLFMTVLPAPQAKGDGQ